jgi:dethiobiotin synthetase
VERLALRECEPFTSVREGIVRAAGAERQAENVVVEGDGGLCVRDDDGVVLNTSHSEAALLLRRCFALGC